MSLYNGQERHLVPMKAEWLQLGRVSRAPRVPGLPSGHGGDQASLCLHKGCMLPASLQDEKPGTGPSTGCGNRVNGWEAPARSFCILAPARMGISSHPSVPSHICPPFFPPVKFDLILPTFVPAFGDL